MLTLVVPPGEPKEYFNSVDSTFVYGDPFPGATITMEHSLYTISKWEEKWKIPYLSKKEKTPEQTIDYIRFMAFPESIDDVVFENLTEENIKQINEYINGSFTAAKTGNIAVQEGKSRYNPDMSADDIYASMVMARIPFECQHWHISRLLALLDIIGKKQNPPKKMGKNELLRRNAKLNAARKAKHHTKG